MKVKILPAPTDVHDGVSRYVSSLAQALVVEGLEVVHAGEDYDVLHLTAAHRYDPEWRVAKAQGKRLVITVHDLIPEHFHLEGPQYSGVAERAEILAAADAVIAVSQYTKDDIVRTYGIAPAKVTIVHNGVSPTPAPTSTSNYPSPYLLWVGRRAGYKNFFWFVGAVASMLRMNDWHVICTGGQDFGRKERLWMWMLGVRRRFRVVQASDAELAELYENALCLVMPSRAEGFGLPVIEALSHGCPAVVPMAHVFPEIGGDAALYYTPNDKADLRRKIRACLDPQVNINLHSRAPEYRARFSWAHCAQRTAAAYGC